MSTEILKTEKVTVEKAVHHLLETCARITERVTHLEKEFKEIREVSIKREQEIQTSLTNMREDLSRRIDETQVQANEWNARTMLKLDEYQQLLKVILEQLEVLKKEESAIHSNVEDHRVTNVDRVTSEQSYARTIHHAEAMKDYTSHVAGNTTATPISQPIVIPPSSAIPTFSGKYSERPNQFLIRVQEYAETVHGWDHTTLLRGISQFLRDTALEWYCQLKAYHRQPETWVEFADIFLSQFNSPIRSARQEQEWYECKQRENETINEFLVRLRSIWIEQKPKESEVDLVRHLLCKMRSDLLSMIGVSRGTSLDEIIFEAQKAEEILYRRNKEKRRFEILKQVSSPVDTVDDNKGISSGYVNSRKPFEARKANYVTSSRTIPFERNMNSLTNREYMAKPQQKLSYNAQEAVDHSVTQDVNSTKCYNCGLFGHLARNCFKQRSSNYQTATITTHPKNGREVLVRRDTNAHL